MILLKLTCPAWISDCDSAIRVAIPFSLCVINGATENEAKVQKTCKASLDGDDLGGGCWGSEANNRTG